MFVLTPIVVVTWGTSGVDEWVNVGTEFQGAVVAVCNFFAAFLTTARCSRGSSGESKSGNCQEEAAATLRAMDASRELPP